MPSHTFLTLKFLIALVGLCMAISSTAETATATIDQVFAKISADQPGCNVAAIENGRITTKKGYGLANLELNVPLDGSQVHRMGSMSKQFTAMAVLLLAEEGKISLEEDIHTYLPYLQNYGAKVSVNSMLGHYSGMGDYDLVAGSYEGPLAKGAIGLRSVAGGAFRLGNEDYLTIEEFYEVVKAVPLAQSPDQEFLYSNLAYFLLSMLVEEVSGQTLRDYADARIFKPLGMQSTFFSDDPVEIVPNRAYGYKKNAEGSYVNDMTNLFWVGDGGLHTNLDDLLLWDLNFYYPRVGRDPVKLMQQMLSPNSKYKSGKTHYANGQFVGETNGHVSYFHGGGWLGTSTFYIRFPERKQSFAMMCNDAGLATDKLLQGSIAAMLETPPRARTGRDNASPIDDH